MNLENIEGYLHQVVTPKVAMIFILGLAGLIFVRTFFFMLGKRRETFATALFWSLLYAVTLSVAGAGYYVLANKSNEKRLKDRAEREKGTLTDSF